MGKYSQYEKKKQVKRRIHPIWTGIGFLMIIIVPVMTWAASTLIVGFGQQQGWPILRSFPRYVEFPGMLTSTIPALWMLTRIDNLPAIFVFFLFMLVVFSGLFSLLYAVIYRVVGPPRYAPDDVPAPRIKTKPFKR